VRRGVWRDGDSCGMMGSLWMSQTHAVGTRTQGGGTGDLWRSWGQGGRRDAAEGALPHRQSADYCQRWWQHLELVVGVVGRGAAVARDSGGQGSSARGGAEMRWAGMEGRRWRLQTRMEVITQRKNSSGRRSSRGGTHRAGPS
jgi:hypothetical protein